MSLDKMTERKRKVGVIQLTNEEALKDKNKTFLE